MNVKMKTTMMMAYAMFNTFFDCCWAWQIHPRSPAAGLGTNPSHAKTCYSPIRNKPFVTINDSITKIYYKDTQYGDDYYSLTSNSSQRRRRALRRVKRRFANVSGGNNNDEGRYRNRQYFLTQQSSNLSSRDSARKIINKSILPTKKRVSLSKKKSSLAYYDRSWDDFDDQHIMTNLYTSVSGNDNSFSTEEKQVPSYYDDKYSTKIGSSLTKKKNRRKSVMVSSSPMNDWLPSMTVSLMFLYMGILAFFG
jgi:hypothetical protein